MSRAGQLLALCAVLAAAGGCGGEDVPEGEAIRFISAIEWSSDGGSLALLEVRIGGDDAAVYVVGSDGSGLRLVRENLNLVESFTFSPRRSELLLVVDGDVQVLNLTDGSLLNLSDHPARDLEPDWSPDGERVVFSSARGGDFDLYVVGRDGSGLRRITRSGIDERVPAWSPHGKLIAFHAGGSSLYTIAPNGSDEKLYLDGLSGHVVNYCCWRPAWSSDSRTIATDLGSVISLVDVASGNVRELDGLGTSPRFSPDGSAIIFDRIVEDPQAYTGYRYPGAHIADVEGKRVRRLLPSGGDGPIIEAAWSPDRRRIAVLIGNTRREVVLLDPTMPDAPATTVYTP